MHFLQVRTASCAATACVNSFGDEQLAVDLVADKLLFEALKYSVSELNVQDPPGVMGTMPEHTRTGLSPGGRAPRHFTPAPAPRRSSSICLMLAALA